MRSPATAWKTSRRDHLSEVVELLNGVRTCLGDCFKKINKFVFINSCLALDVQSYRSLTAVLVTRDRRRSDNHNSFS